MIPVLLILIPLLAGLAAFFIKGEKQPRAWVLFTSLLTLVVSIGGLCLVKDPKWLAYKTDWLTALNSSFSVRLDGMGQILCLLNAVAFPLIFIATWNRKYTNAKNFLALMLLGQAGMMGVFLAMDALLFYFFWELALIPMYFLCSQWGGEKRIAVTFKFFIYTFVGSLLMLIGILIVYSNTENRSFDISAFYNAELSYKQQDLVFWLFFAAFAIKMPIFPFHTWQPDTYEQAPTATTMVLSGVMVKMGVFGIIRWLMPVTPVAFFQRGDLVTTFSILGMIYASLIAIRQNDLKRLVAYSSIAHIGLMCATLFAENKIGVQGVMFQMFNHGINIIGLWIVVEWIERRFGTRKISDLGGVAEKAPALAIMFVVVALANIGLPLTNAFAGEFLMFNGIYSSKVTQYYLVFTIAAGLTIILAAVYMLNMLRRVLYGEMGVIPLSLPAQDIRLHEKFALGVIVVIIFWLGIYPQAMLGITNEVTDFILRESDISHLLKK
jgi:NADH-quinone oxidoreductase subunit M